MAVTPLQTVNGASVGLSTITLTSWTPGAGDLVILDVITRQTTVTHSSVSGNGLTWIKVNELNGGTNIRASKWYGVGALPTTGSIVVTLSGAPTTAEAVATRYSGADATTPIEVSASASGSSNAPSVTLTTLTANAYVCGGFFDRSATFTVGTGETVTSINNKTGSGGDTLNISTEYQIVASPGSVTLDGGWSASVNWAAIAVAIKPAVSSITGTLIQTEANDTLSSAGALAISGSLTSTLDNDTLTASGGNINAGQFIVTEANDTLTASAALAISGSLTKTEANDTLTGAGVVAITGAATITHANDTLSAAGALAITGSLVSTNQNDTLNAVGTLAIVGSLIVNEANDTLASTGGILVLHPYAKNRILVDVEVTAFMIPDYIQTSSILAEVTSFSV